VEHKKCPPLKKIKKKKNFFFQYKNEKQNKKKLFFKQNSTRQNPNTQIHKRVNMKSLCTDALDQIAKFVPEDFFKLCVCSRSLNDLVATSRISRSSKPTIHKAMSSMPGLYLCGSLSYIYTQRHASEQKDPISRVHPEYKAINTIYNLYISNEDFVTPVHAMNATDLLVRFMRTFPLATSIAEYRSNETRPFTEICRNAFPVSKFLHCRALHGLPCRCHSVVAKWCVAVVLKLDSEFNLPLHCHFVSKLEKHSHTASKSYSNLQNFAKIMFVRARTSTCSVVHTRASCLHCLTKALAPYFTEYDSLEFASSVVQSAEQFCVSAYKTFTCFHEAHDIVVVSSLCAALQMHHFPRPTFLLKLIHSDVSFNIVNILVTKLILSFSNRRVLH
jgi:hypothetical protein